MRSRLVAFVVLLLVALAFAATAPAVPRDVFAGTLLAMPALVAAPKGMLAKASAWLKEKFGDTKTDAEIAALAAELVEEQDAPVPAQTPPITTSTPADLAAAIRAELAPLQQQVAGLNEALTAEKAARQQAQTALETQQAKERGLAITAALDDAVAKGRIVPGKRDDWKARLEKDFDGVSAILAEIPGNPAVVKSTPSGTKPGDSPAGTGRTTPPAGGFGVRPDALAYVTNATQASA